MFRRTGSFLSKITESSAFPAGKQMLVQCSPELIATLQQKKYIIRYYVNNKLINENILPLLSELVASSNSSYLTISMPSNCLESMLERSHFYIFLSQAESHVSLEPHWN